MFALKPLESEAEISKGAGPCPCTTMIGVRAVRARTVAGTKTIALRATATAATSADVDTSSAAHPAVPAPRPPAREPEWAVRREAEAGMRTMATVEAAAGMTRIGT